MPAWSNNDNHASKPKWDVERETREQFQAVTANTTNSGNTVITFAYNDGGQNNLANVISIGDSVATTGVGANGYAGFFKSNVTVSSINGNNVVFSSGTYAAVATGTTVVFDKAIVYNTNKPVEVTYNPDTILVTATRAANGNTAIANTGNFSVGWVHVQKKTNNDGTVRYLKETLVALANPVASNTSSVNTSFGSVVTGL
jgi:hypothetical protein